MQVRDVMTHKVISIADDQLVLEAARLMLQNEISGLPVVDAGGNLVGMLTEGDFLRRNELGTERRRPKWLEFVAGPGRLAEEYVHAAGRRVHEVMSHDPVFVFEDDSLDKVVEIMERRHIKRLPVMRDGKVVGIVSRANLMRALLAVARPVEAPSTGDEDTCRRVYAAFMNQKWAPRVNVLVRDAVVQLHGTITDERERQACIVVAENVPGVKQVHDHLVWVEPISGTAFSSPEDANKLPAGIPAAPAVL